MEAQALLDNSLRASRTMVSAIKATLIFIVVVAFGIGWYGFTVDCPDGDKNSLYEAGMLSLQLFVLNVSPEHLCNNVTRWAAVIAPLSTLGVLLTLSHRVISYIRSKFLVLCPPAEVYLGCGKIATSIALQRYSKKFSSCPPESGCVVFVDDSPAPLIQEYQSELGCAGCHWFGNAMSEEILHSVNALSAKKVWVLTGDDKKNIHIAQSIEKLRDYSNNKFQFSPLKWLRKGWCFVRGFKDEPTAINVNVHDQSLVHSLTVVGFSDQNINYFSMPRVAARVILLQNPPRLPKIDANTRRPEHSLHVAVVGDGDLIEALIERAIVHLIYSEVPKDCIKITIISEKASRIADVVQERIPHGAAYADVPEMESILPVADIRAIDCLPVNLTSTHWSSAQDLDEPLCHPFSAVYVSDQEDINTITWAIRMASLRESINEGRCNDEQPIYACLSQARHEHGAMDLSETKSTPENVYQVRIYDCLASEESYPGELRDSAARLVNLCYSDHQYSELSVEEREVSAKALWETLAEEYRNSSRCSADHAQIKVACLYQDGRTDTIDIIRQLEADIQNAPKDGLDNGTASISNDVMYLMRLEHRRFVVERLLEGWIPIPQVQAQSEEEREALVKLKKDKYRLNETLVLFDDLSGDDEKRKDRRIVEFTPAILAASESV